MSKETFDFSEALRRMKQGKRVKRFGWDLMGGIWVDKDKRICFKYREDFPNPAIYLVNSYNSFFSLDDILATDWEEVEE